MLPFFIFLSSQSLLLPLSGCLFLTRSLFHPCLSSYLFLPPIIPISFSLSHPYFSLSPIPISLFLPSLFLSPPSLSSPSPSRTHASLFYLSLIPVSPSPSKWLSLSHSLSLPPLSLFLSFSPTHYTYLSLSLSRSCSSFYRSISHHCLSFFLPLLPLFLSSSLCDSICLFLYLYLSLSLSPIPFFFSFSHSWLSSNLLLSHPVFLSIFSLALSLPLLSLSFSRPYLFFYLSRTRSLPIFLSLPSQSPSLSPTHGSLPICFSPTLDMGGGRRGHKWVKSRGRLIWMAP